MYDPDELEMRAKYPMLYVDIDCTSCGKLMALSNATHIDHQYLCPTCFERNTMSEEKSLEMETLLNAITKQAFGMSREEATTKQICVICKQDATEFRDALSEKEYSISKLCQKCQDQVFNHEVFEEDECPNDDDIF